MGWMSLFGLDTKVARARSNFSELAVAVEDRLELARLEWAEHQRILTRLAILGVALLCVGTVAALVVTLAVLIQFWDTPWREAAGWSLAVLWLALVLVLALRLQHWAQSLGGLFVLTRAELRRDLENFKQRKQKVEES